MTIHIWHSNRKDDSHEQSLDNAFVRSQGLSKKKKNEVSFGLVIF